MAYKTIPYTDGKALGSKVADDVLCTFNVNQDSSSSLRIELITTDSEAIPFQLEDSMDGTTWNIVKASGETGVQHTIIINASDDTKIPLRPLCRVSVASAFVGAAVVEKCLVAKNN